MNKNGPATEPRPGFYWATTPDREVIARYQAAGRGAKRVTAWVEFVSDDPTLDKQPRILTDVTSYRPASKAEVDQAFARVLTLEEQADMAYQAYRQRKYRPTREVVIPPERRFKPGEAVEIGELHDCRVVKTYEDGQLIAAQLTRDMTTGIRSVEVWPWLTVMPITTAVVHFAPRRDHVLSYSWSDVESILNRVVEFNVADNARYQREYAWTLEDKQRLIRAALNGRSLGKLVFVKRPYPLQSQLLDGKQRIDALLGYVAGQYPLDGVYWNQLCKGDRRAIFEAQLMVAEINEERVDEVFILQTFLDVNAAGVPQSEEHLNKVRAQLQEARACKLARKSA